MKKTKLSIIGLIIYYLIIIAVYLIDRNSIFLHINKYLLPVIAIIFGIITIRYFGIKTVQGKSVYFLVLALFLGLASTVRANRANLPGFVRTGVCALSYAEESQYPAEYRNAGSDFSRTFSDLSPHWSCSRLVGSTDSLA